MKLKISCLILFTLLVYTFSMNATIRFVSKTGSSTPPYTSWETASDSIQKCINISEFGDTIYVANGVYREKIEMIPGLSLIGAGMDSCVIDVSLTGNPSVQVVDSCLLIGFKITSPSVLNTWGLKSIGFGSVILLNNIVNVSLGIYVGNSNVSIYKNVFKRINSKGIWIFNSNSIIKQNLIYIDRNSYTASPTAIHIEATNNNYYPIVDSNYIEIRGLGVSNSFGSRPTISNNVIKLKYAPTGIHLGYSDSAYVYNNLILVDSIGASEGIHNTGTQYLQLYNNYLIGDFDVGFYLGPDNIAKNNVVEKTVNGVVIWGNGNLQYQYNVVWESENAYSRYPPDSAFTPDNTNLLVDPMIVNDDTIRGELDFHLQKYSPLIDAGDPNILDKDGSRSDIGLFGGPFGESYTYLDLAPRAPINLTALVDTNYIRLSWNRNTESDTSYYKVYRDTVINFQIDSTKLVSSSSDTFYVQMNPHNVTKYVYKVTCIDKQGNESDPSDEIVVDITSVSIDDYPMTISDYRLYQNYPNPFNPGTTISYRLKERGYVKLYVYDIKGELVSVLVNKVQEAEFYQVEFNANSQISNVKGNLASGIYIYQIHVIGENNIPVFTDFNKMILIK
jgi:hypothetical protein